VAFFLRAGVAGCLGDRFFRGQCSNAQGVDIGPHQLVQRTIHELVSLQRAQPGERAGDDPRTEMSASVPRAGMACVAVTVVD
jgi:hypothetical protein